MGFWGEVNNDCSYKKQKLSYEGYLVKFNKKSDSKTKITKYYYELRENFLIRFYEQNHKPVGMICMDGLIVREMDPNSYLNKKDLNTKLKNLVGFEIYHKNDCYKPK